MNLSHPEIRKMTAGQIVILMRSDPKRTIAIYKIADDMGVDLQYLNEAINPLVKQGFLNPVNRAMTPHGETARDFIMGEWDREDETVIQLLYSCTGTLPMEYLAQVAEYRARILTPSNIKIEGMSGKAISQCLRKWNLAGIVKEQVPGHYEIKEPFWSLIGKIHVGQREMAA